MPGETEPPILDSNKTDSNDLEKLNKESSKLSITKGSVETKDVTKEGSHISLNKEGDGKSVSKQPTQTNMTADDKKSGEGVKTDQLPPVTSIKDNPAADLRHMRHIIAEDQDWCLAIVPSLIEICLRHIVKNFLSK